MSEEHLKTLVQASAQVLYRMGPDWSELRHLSGGRFLADTTEPDRDWLQQYIHPDDQERVLEAIREAILSESVFELGHRVLRLDGTLDGRPLRSAVITIS